MDKTYQKILIELKDLIISDLDVHNGVVPSLRSEYFLKDEDVHRIENATSREEKAEILLEILHGLGLPAFHVFHKSLNQHYPWLHTEIDKKLNSFNHDNEPIGRNISHLNIPPVSPLTVKRTNKMSLLMEALRTVKSNEYILMHGFKGFGKSSLVASVLQANESGIMDLFENEVYWVKFSRDCEVNDEILCQMNHLYNSIKFTSAQKQSEIMENLSITMKEAIYYYFNNHQNALLILDDVYHCKIVEEFNFHCKILLLTTDLGVLYEKPVTVIEMNQGFTELETLGLFAKVLEMDVSRLPSEARQIHAECKGMPLLIAMLAARFESFKHDMRTNTGRWRYYLEHLNSKSSENNEFLDLQESTYSLCIKDLEPKLKERYELLAIFTEDVNIMPKTLEIFWEEKSYKVDEEMLLLCRKSLAARRWNEDLKSYTYGVHDLLLRYLRKQIEKNGKDKLRNMHKLLIDKYHQYCKGNFAKLPNDNYSYAYIGHHLEQAEMYHEFSKLYFDFDFLEAKIRHSGLNDLLIDLEKYQNHITNNNVSSIKKLENLQKFLKNNANILDKHRTRKCLDLIQIGLNSEEFEYVQQIAQQRAKAEPCNLYISCEVNSLNEQKLFSDIVNVNSTVGVFTDDPNVFLIGCTDGQIISWDHQTRKTKIHHSHNKSCKIKKILVSNSGKYFLSLSDDGISKLFESPNSNDSNKGTNIPYLHSPREKQTAWKSFFSNDSEVDDSLRTFRINNQIITDITFSHDDKQIATCTDKGAITVWYFTGELKWRDSIEKYRLSHIIFTQKDDSNYLLHVLCLKEDESLDIRTYKECHDKYEYLSQYNMKIESTVIYLKQYQEEQSLLIVNKKRALLLKWFLDRNHNTHTHEFREIIGETDPNIFYTAANLTWDDKFLIIAASNGIISVMQARNTHEKCFIFKGYVNSLSSYNVKDEYHLICGNENKCINCWQIKIEEKHKTLPKTVFDAKVNNLNVNNTIFLKRSLNSITIQEGIQYDKIKMLPQYGKDIIKIQYCDQSRLIYITDYGTVVIYHTFNQDSNRMPNQKERVFHKLIDISKFYRILEMHDSYVIIAQQDNMLQLSFLEDNLVHLNLEESEVLSNVYKITEDVIMTVSINFFITIMSIYNYTQSKICEFNLDIMSIEKIKISLTSMGILKSHFAVLTTNYTLYLFKTYLDNLSFKELISNNKTITFPQILSKEYKIQPTAIEFSKDEQFLAIGFCNGLISIIDVKKRIELRKLTLHFGLVRELYWAPVTTPILLSVNSHELAWWNVSYLKNVNTIIRRSRMGLSKEKNSQLNSSLSSNELCKNVNASSIDNNSSNSCHDNSNVTCHYDKERFWKLKKPKFGADNPALLTVVQLAPSSIDDKALRISDDFAKLLTVDNKGMIRNYTLFQ